MDWLFFAVIGVLMAAAIAIRRKVNNPDNAFGQWYQARVHPRLMQAGKVVMVLTVAVWFIIYFTASDEDRGSLSDLLKSFTQTFEPSSGATGTTGGNKDRP